MAKFKLSVVVPCYNEESRIADGFNHYWLYLKKQKYPWELIFVDDGSSDKTWELIKKAAHGKKDIKVIHYSKNRGKGYAIIQGVKKASGQIILFTDLDHSVPIETIESFYPYFQKGYQVVIGSRRVSGAQILVHQHAAREFLGRGFTALVNLLIYHPVADATCGFKAFDSPQAKKIFNKITIYDWAFDAEILFLCKKFKIKLAQVPVIWRDAQGSKVSFKTDITRSLLGLVKIRLNDFKKAYD